MSDFSFSGTHVIADIAGIDPVAIRDDRAILRGMDEGLGRSGATLCGLQVRQFEPAGLTAVYLLSESHASVHTYPEFNALFFDAFTCGGTCDPKAFLDALVAVLGPCEVQLKVLGRGEDERVAAREGVRLYERWDITDISVISGDRRRGLQRGSHHTEPMPPCAARTGPRVVRASTGETAPGAMPSARRPATMTPCNSRFPILTP